jgi:hypothetical protein
MNFRVSSLAGASRKTPALVTLVCTQDLVQLGPLLTVVKVERLGELVELFHRLVLEVRGVLVTELFLSTAGQYSVRRIEKRRVQVRRDLRKGGSLVRDAR